MTASTVSAQTPPSETEGYDPPHQFSTFDPVDTFGHLRHVPTAKQATFDFAETTGFFYAGRLDLLRRLCVSVIGTRRCSSRGRDVASSLAASLVGEGLVVVSGLAKGIDTAAHRGAIDANGDTVAVIGTPLNRAYPAENKELQEEIHRNHLLVSPFDFDAPVRRQNFPERNKVMALLSEASVIVEAGESSGTIHQATACKNQGRWLFFHQHLFREYPTVDWPRSFLRDYDRALVARSVDDILAVLLP